MADGDYERVQARQEELKRLGKKLEEWKKSAAVGRDSSAS